MSTSNQSDPPLQRLLTDVPSLGVEIVSFLRIADILRLKCSHRSISGWMDDQKSDNESFQAFLRWVRDVEVLILLECPTHLFRKMSQALLEPSCCRIYFTSEEEEDKVKFDSLVALYSNNNIPLFGVAPSDMEAMEDDMYNYSFSEVLAEEEEAVHEAKRLKRVFSSQFCRHPRRELYRPFFVRGKGYCGECVSGDLYLRILFGTEHDIVYSRWLVSEEDCQNPDDPEDETHACILRKPDEFSVTLWEHRYEIVKRFQFVARGERDPTVTYTHPQLDPDGNAIFEDEEEGHPGA